MDALAVMADVSPKIVISDIIPLIVPKLQPGKRPDSKHGGKKDMEFWLVVCKLHTIVLSLQTLHKPFGKCESVVSVGSLSNCSVFLLFWSDHLPELKDTQMYILYDTIDF